MLDVIFYRDDRGRLGAVAASGHAGFGEYGDDVVCAAVSAVLQAARLGLSEFAGGVTARQESGQFELELNEAARDRESVRAIVTTAELAIEQIARRYPGHVRIVRAQLEVRREAGSPGG